LYWILGIMFFGMGLEILLVRYVWKKTIELGQTGKLWRAFVVFNPYVAWWFLRNDERRPLEERDEYYKDLLLPRVGDDPLDPGRPKGK